MIPIPDNIAAKISVLVGNAEAISNVPVVIFDELRIDFLTQLSRRLLTDPRTKALPDVATFAYWCRKANLLRMRTQHLRNGNLRMGLGVVFHICPANVPVNFAFSMAFGLLSGNVCVLRLPSKETPTVDILVSAIQAQLDAMNQPALREALLLLRSERDDEVNRFWISVADGRVVWGGDDTVIHMRTFPCKPRSREVAFSDRYSLCVLTPHSIVEMDEQALKSFCRDMFNDIYLMDQAACSSPQLVVWLGEPAEVVEAQQRLWPALVQTAQQRYVLKAVHSVDKFVDACRHALGKPLVQGIERHGNILYRIKLSGPNQSQDECRGYHGTVHEVILPSLDALAPMVSERYQTMTVSGVDNGVVRDWIVRHGLRGIDRVVPVGRALDMDAVWDGHDILSSLSRLVVV